MNSSSRRSQVRETAPAPSKGKVEVRDYREGDDPQLRALYSEVFGISRSPEQQTWKHTRFPEFSKEFCITVAAVAQATPT